MNIRDPESIHQCRICLRVVMNTMDLESGLCGTCRMGGAARLRQMRADNPAEWRRKVEKRANETRGTGDGPARKRGRPRKNPVEGTP